MMNSDVYGYYIIKATEMQQTYGKELLTIFWFFCMELDWKIHVVKCKNFRDEHFRGMKFATQISPKCRCIYSFVNKFCIGRGWRPRQPVCAMFFGSSRRRPLRFGGAILLTDLRFGGIYINWWILAARGFFSSLILASWQRLSRKRTNHIRNRVAKWSESIYPSQQKSHLPPGGRLSPVPICLQNRNASEI